MRNILIVLFILLRASSAFSQDKKDQLLIDQLEKATSDSTRIRLMRELSVSLLYTTPEKSKYYSEKCLALSQRTGDLNGEAYANNNLGSYYFMKSDYVKAMDAFLKALRLFKAVGNKRMISGAYTNIANINMKQGDLDEARNNLKASIRLKEEINTQKGLPHAYQSLAAISYFEKDFDQALIQYEKAIRISREMNDERMEAASLNGFAAVQFKKENYEEAIKEYRKALALFKKIGGSERSISGVYHNMAQAYRKMGKYNEAIELLNASLQLAKEIKSNEDIKQAYLELSAFYKEKGDLSNALIAQEFAAVYKDSVINESTLRSIGELQEKYKSEERKKEIRDLQVKNGDLQVKSTLQYSLLIVSVGAFLLTVLVIFFYIKQLRAKQQRKHTELEQRTLRAQMNPHFIFNSLNSIQRMYIEGKEDIANDYMADFSRLLRSILENSGKNVIRLKEELEVVQLYMDLETMRTDHSFHYACEVAEDIDPLLVKIPPLIFQPYLENAIWHGIISKEEMGIIRLTIKKGPPGKLICQVTDNGIGFYSGKKLNGNKENASRGMQITAERLGGEDNVVIGELSTGGTCITVTINYTV